MKNFFDSVLEILENAVKREYNGNRTHAAHAWGISNSLLGMWLNRKRKPTLEYIAPIFDLLGVSLSLPDIQNPSKDICFIREQIVPAGEQGTPPDAEDYLAVPLVGEVGAGPGYLPQEEIKSWFLAYKNHSAVRYRRNLIAAEIGPTSTSMQPTLNPGDIVLIDRDDRKVTKQGGQIMLVLDPVDGSGMVKRVYVHDLPSGDSQITYASDNVSRFAPIVYSLKKDFLGDWERCIVGHVVWRWSEMTD